MRKALVVIVTTIAAAIAMWGWGAAPASAGYITFQVSGQSWAGTLTNCEGTMWTFGGPPPTTVEPDEWTFYGTGFDPCDTSVLELNDMPEVLFSGSGSIWTATIPTYELYDAGSGCTFRDYNVYLTSIGGVNGPYAGSSSPLVSGPFPCGYLGASISFTDMVFY